MGSQYGRNSGGQRVGNHRNGRRGGRRGDNGESRSSVDGRQHGNGARRSDNTAQSPRHRATRTPTQFTIDIAALRTGNENRTTVMVRNIPNRYTREGLLEDIQEFRGTFDFFYLPMDLSAHSNVGYAFINFASSQELIAFYTKFHKQKWKRHKSQKICEIAFGRLQGKKELISQFRERNNRATIPKDYQPICFHTSGSERGDIELNAFTFVPQSTTTA